MKLLALLVAVIGLSQVALGDKIINCYWGTWANYRPGDGKFVTADVNPNLCTHLSYTFFGISEAGEFKSLDSWLDLDDGLGFISKTIALKKINPKLKVVAVVGGWNEGSQKYSALAADAGKRSTFITTALAFIQKYGFDGMDLDWEYPGQRGGSDADRANFVTLLREIKQAFDQHGLELSIAVGASKSTASISYDIPAISQYLTFINVMTYDFHMASDGFLGINAPLPEVTEAIDYWLEQGAPANKLVLGLAFYGHSYQLADSSRSTPGSPSNGAGTAGPFTRQNGILGYNEICVNNWPSVFDDQLGTPYAIQGNQWVGYDNPRSLELKLDLVKSRNLGGAMTWSIETDDFHGRCGETYPLLKTMNRALGVEVGSDPAPAPTEAPPKTPKPDDSAPPTADCPADGFYANRSDCSRFYQCAGGIRYDFQCSNGLYFDPSTKSCNWADAVNCA